jgi:DNA phosphorothioation-dependent restriction protein DptG
MQDAGAMCAAVHFMRLLSSFEKILDVLLLLLAVCVAANMRVPAQVLLQQHQHVGVCFLHS